MDGFLFPMIQITLTPIVTRLPFMSSIFLLSAHPPDIKKRLARKCNRDGTDELRRRDKGHMGCGKPRNTPVRLL
jgi:hypothetical protein